MFEFWYSSIGYNHDETAECPDRSYIMSTVVSAGPASFTWSNCSKDFVQSFLRFVNLLKVTVNVQLIPSPDV